jgi:hypothetical protein
MYYSIIWLSGFVSLTCYFVLRKLYRIFFVYYNTVTWLSPFPFLNTYYLISLIPTVPLIISVQQLFSQSYNFKSYLNRKELGDNCTVFEKFMASIGDLMVANWVYWQRVSRASKQIFATIKSIIDAMKFSNTIQLSPF